MGAFHFHSSKAVACLLDSSSIEPRSWHIKSKKCAKAALIRALVKQHGQLQAITVRTNESGAVELVDGAEVLAALREDGVDTVLCINHGSISAAQAKLIYIAMHYSQKRTAEELLAEAVHELEKEYGLKSLQNQLPLGRDTIEDYVEMYNFIFENYIKPQQKQQQSLF